MGRRRMLRVSEYAEHRKRKGLKGCSRQSVYNAIQKGWIHKTRGGFIDADAADASWAAQSMPRADGASAGSDMVSAEDLNLHRARKEKALADLKELEEAQTRGQLVDRDAVKKEWFALARSTRDRVLGVPDRLAGQLAAETDEHTCRVLLERELRDALREIAE